MLGGIRQDNLQHFHTGIIIFFFFISVQSSCQAPRVADNLHLCRIQKLVLVNAPG